MSKIFEALLHSQMPETSRSGPYTLPNIPPEVAKNEEHELSLNGQAAARSSFSPEAENKEEHEPSSNGEADAASGAVPLNDVACRFIKSRLSSLSPILPGVGQNMEAAEQYRIIRTKIVQHPTRCRVILVTSACAGDGKSVTSLGLAYTMASRRHTPVLLLSGDIRRCSTEPELDFRIGLTDVLAKKCLIDDALIVVKDAPNLYLLPSGNVRADFPEWLDSPEWQMLLVSLQKRFNYIIIDAPPFGLVSDYYHLQSCSEGIVFVLRPEHTSRVAFSAAMKGIPRQKLLGVIVNDAKKWLFWHRHESYSSSKSVAATASGTEDGAGIEQLRSKHAV